MKKQRKIATELAFYALVVTIVALFVLDLFGFEKPLIAGGYTIGQGNLVFKVPHVQKLTWLVLIVPILFFSARYFYGMYIEDQESFKKSFVEEIQGGLIFGCVIGSFGTIQDNMAVNYFLLISLPALTIILAVISVLIFSIKNPSRVIYKASGYLSFTPCFFSIYISFVAFEEFGVMGGFVVGLFSFMPIFFLSIVMISVAPLIIGITEKVFSKQTWSFFSS